MGFLLILAIANNISSQSIFLWELFSWNVSDIFLALFLLIIILPIILKIFFFEIYQVHRNSMKPTILDGDCLLVLKRFYKINVGDIIALKIPYIDKSIAIKRCVAVAGMIVQYNTLDLPKVFDEKKTMVNAEEDSSKKVISNKHLFVLGDNYKESRDSRHWGPIHENLVNGKVLLILFSISPKRKTNKYLHNSMFPVKIFIFFKHIRWSRLFKPLNN